MKSVVGEVPLHVSDCLSRQTKSTPAQCCVDPVGLAEHFDKRSFGIVDRPESMMQVDHQRNLSHPFRAVVLLKPGFRELARGCQVIERPISPDSQVVVPTPVKTTTEIQHALDRILAGRKFFADAVLPGFQNGPDL